MCFSLFLPSGLGSAGAPPPPPAFPAVTHAAGTAIFHDAFEIDVSMLVGTELPGALIVSAFVVLPFTKLTFTCGVAVFVWFASTNTRTHALRPAIKFTSCAG